MKQMYVEENICFEEEARRESIREKKAVDMPQGVSQG
jgi:hypothetical protein